MKARIMADETKLYPFDMVEVALREYKKQAKLLVRDVILLLLYAIKDKPIYGRTMLMKQVFLTYEEILKKHGIVFQDPKFVPYKFGPYSFIVTQVLEDLHFAGYIRIEGRRNTKKEKFLLTDAGIKEAYRRFQTLPPKIREEIVKKRIGWDQLGTRGILNYVYTKYPKYKEKSEIKKKYKEIIWGQGKG